MNLTNINRIFLAQPVTNPEEIVFNIGLFLKVTRSNQPTQRRTSLDQNSLNQVKVISNLTGQDYDFAPFTSRKIFANIIHFLPLKDDVLDFLSINKKFSEIKNKLFRMILNMSALGNHSLPEIFQRNFQSKIIVDNCDFPETFDIFSNSIHSIKFSNYSSLLENIISLKIDLLANEHKNLLESLDFLCPNLTSLVIDIISFKSTFIGSLDLKNLTNLYVNTIPSDTTLILRALQLPKLMTLSFFSIGNAANLTLASEFSNVTQLSIDCIGNKATVTVLSNLSNLTVLSLKNIQKEATVTFDSKMDNLTYLSIGKMEPSSILYFHSFLPKLTYILLGNIDPTAALLSLRPLCLVITYLPNNIDVDLEKFKDYMQSIEVKI